MKRAHPTTIAEYISAAPLAGQAHLRRIHKILRRVAPEAEETIKWGAPFFVDPRFVFSFAAFKAHAVFAPTPAALDAFRQELENHQTTKNYLKIPYDRPVPEQLLRKIAKWRLRHMGVGESFW